MIFQVSYFIITPPVIQAIPRPVSVPKERISVSTQIRLMRSPKFRQLLLRYVNVYTRTTNVCPSGNQTWVTWKCLLSSCHNDQGTRWVCELLFRRYWLLGMRQSECAKMESTGLRSPLDVCQSRSLAPLAEAPEQANRLFSQKHLGYNSFCCMCCALGVAAGQEQCLCYCPHPTHPRELRNASSRSRWPGDFPWQQLQNTGVPFRNILMLCSMAEGQCEDSACLQGLSTFLKQ